MLGAAAVYTLSRRPEAEILEVTGQASTTRAYFMVGSIFVVTQPPPLPPGTASARAPLCSLAVNGAEIDQWR